MQTNSQKCVQWNAAATAPLALTFSLAVTSACFGGRPGHRNEVQRASPKTNLLISATGFVSEDTRDTASRMLFLICVVYGAYLFFIWHFSIRFPVTAFPALGASRWHGVTDNTLSWTPLDGWSDRHRDLYLTTHNTHKKQTSTRPEGFEPAIPASDRPQIQASHRAATRIGVWRI
jgi:hypothetical protein